MYWFARVGLLGSYVGANKAHKLVTWELFLLCGEEFVTKFGANYEEFVTTFVTNCVKFVAALLEIAGP